MFLVLVLFVLLLPAWWLDITALTISVMIGASLYGLANWYGNRAQIKELWELSRLGNRKVDGTK
jgi:hypothetical protein